MNYGFSWLFIVVICVAIEAFTLGLTTIWFAIGAVAAWISYTVGLGVHGQIIIFLTVSVICLIFTRPVAVKKLKVGIVKTNADSLVGQCFKVESAINNINNEGSVIVRGQPWSARSSDDSIIIDKDEIVCVKAIKGVKLIVEKKSTQ